MKLKFASDYIVRFLDHITHSSTWFGLTSRDPDRRQSVLCTLHESFIHRCEVRTKLHIVGADNYYNSDNRTSDRKLFENVPVQHNVPI